MEKKRESRKLFVLLFSAAFFMGLWTDRLLPGAFGQGSGWIVQAAEEQEMQLPKRQTVREGTTEQALPVIFYDEQGRKVCVKADGVLELTEILRLDVPLEAFAEGQEMLVEIRLTTEEGEESTNRIHIRRRQLHNEEK